MLAICTSIKLDVDSTLPRDNYFWSGHDTIFITILTVISCRAVKQCYNHSCRFDLIDINIYANPVNLAPCSLIAEELKAIFQESCVMCAKLRTYKLLLLLRLSGAYSIIQMVFIYKLILYLLFTSHGTIASMVLHFSPNHSKTGQIVRFLKGRFSDPHCSTVFKWSKPVC